MVLFYITRDVLSSMYRPTPVEHIGLEMKTQSIIQLVSRMIYYPIVQVVSYGPYALYDLIYLNKNIVLSQFSFQYFCLLIVELCLMVVPIGYLGAYLKMNRSVYNHVMKRIGNRAAYVFHAVFFCFKKEKMTQRNSNVESNRNFFTLEYRHTLQDTLLYSLDDESPSIKSDVDTSDASIKHLENDELVDIISKE